MESASWDAAASSFSAALSALSGEPPSSSREERAAFAAQYLAAVMLLKAAGADTSAKGARLYRSGRGLRGELVLVWMWQGLNGVCCVFGRYRA